MLETWTIDSLKTDTQTVCHLKAITDERQQFPPRNYTQLPTLYGSAEEASTSILHKTLDEAGKKYQSKATSYSGENTYIQNTKRSQRNPLCTTSFASLNQLI